jgi:hypothetical protein
MLITEWLQFCHSDRRGGISDSITAGQLFKRCLQTLA